MNLIDLKTFTNGKGNLTVIEKLPFDIKRIFYIYDIDDSIRGGHRHKKTIQAAICLQGKCKIRNGGTYILDDPSKCLIIEPEDWHEMFDFSPDAMLMILASESYDPNDYIYPGCDNKGCICHRELYHKFNCAWFVALTDGVMTMDQNCSGYIPGEMKDGDHHINQRSFYG